MKQMQLREIKVLIVEDSPVMRELLHGILSADPQIKVVGTAANAAEALERIDSLHRRPGDRRHQPAGDEWI